MIHSGKPVYIFCAACGNKGWTIDDHNQHHLNSLADSVNIQGVYLYKDFISEDEENEILPLIDSREPWVPSQEGRAKQDYGPKVGFIKKKASIGNFHGFPDYSIRLFNRMLTTYPDIFSDCKPVEFCILEYTPERGSYIRPHFDDTWIWGNRLITVNLLSETVLRLTREFNTPPYEIAIKMPARSLLVIQDEARYEWHHSINRYDIKSRRVAMTWREFGEEILQQEEYKDFVTEVFDIVNSSFAKCV